MECSIWCRESYEKTRMCVFRQRQTCKTNFQRFYMMYRVRKWKIIESLERQCWFWWVVILTCVVVVLAHDLPRYGRRERVPLEEYLRRRCRRRRNSLRRHTHFRRLSRTGSATNTVIRRIRQVLRMPVGTVRLAATDSNDMIHAVIQRPINISNKS